MPRFTVAQVETAKENLEALPGPDKDSRQIGLQEAMRTLAPTIRKLLAKGYSRGRVLDLLREQGISVSQSTFKQCVATRVSKRLAAGQSADTAATNHTPASATTSTRWEDAAEPPAEHASVKSPATPEPRAAGNGTAGGTGKGTARVI